MIQKSIRSNEFLTSRFGAKDSNTLSIELATPQMNALGKQPLMLQTPQKPWRITIMNTPTARLLMTSKLNRYAGAQRLKERVLSRTVDRIRSHRAWIILGCDC